MWTVFFTIAISLGAFESAAQIEFLGQRSMSVYERGRGVGEVLGLPIPPPTPSQAQPTQVLGNTWTSGMTISVPLESRELRG